MFDTLSNRSIRNQGNCCMYQNKRLLGGTQMQWLPLLEIDMVTGVQILDEALWISHIADTQRKGIIQAMG